MRNLFCLLAVFISFPLARAWRAAARPTPPRPPFWEKGKYQKSQKKKIVGVGVVAAFVLLERLVC
jgi:hypothetical protein